MQFIKKNKQRAYRYGLIAEYLTLFILLMKGHRIIARRYKTPKGEIDIIAKSFKILIFIEVKARKNHLYLYEALRYRQQQRIINAADYFLLRHPRYKHHQKRFDLVLVRKFIPTYIKNAYS